ncbi:MAG: DUF4199 domain-containing protein [Puia sp.]|nr:DUF4199 domain-containing protein [Puia sp.]
MKKTVLTFGLFSAVTVTAMYVFMCLARQSEHFYVSEILIYAAVVLLFAMVFAGIKSYRDQAPRGWITFGEAFKVGILISLVSSLCYAILWIILYNSIFKEFMEQHAAALIEKLKASGATAREITAKKEEIIKHAQLYNNPLSRAGLIFIQGFPAEAIMAVIASFLLKRKQPRLE